ncbi:MAG: cache domain-containing protein, partial [Candidatus Aenigmatarchaeota archaeon]
MLKITLQIKITLLFISILLIILSGIYLIFLPQVEENIKDQAKNNLENIAINTAGYLDHLIEDEINKITVLSKNPVLKSTGASTSEKIGELTLYKTQYRTFDEITLLDTNGTVVGSTDYNYRGDWKTKSWYQEALQGNIVITDAHVILDPWKLVVLVLSPIKNYNESIIGVVSGQIDLEHYWNLVDEIEVGETSQIKIINDNGKILYHANRSKIFSKISENTPIYYLDFSDLGSSEYIDEYNVTFICGYTPFLKHTIYNNTGSWHMMVSQQESEILSGLSDFKQNIFYG